MAREIIEAKITGVDLTDIGANLDRESGEGSHVVLVKRAGDSQMPKTIEELEKENADLAAKLAEKDTSATALEKRVKDAEAKVEALSKSKDEKAPEDDMPEAFRKRFEALEKRAVDAETLANAERDARMESEWIAKSATFKVPGLVAAEFGPIMKRVALTSPQDAAKIEQILKSATEAIRQGGIFNEVGTNGGGDATSATVELRKRAEKLAAEKNIPYAKAYTQVANSDRELVARQRAEQSA